MTNKGDDISISLKTRCVYSIVWSVAQYGSESLTLRKGDKTLTRDPNVSTAQHAQDKPDREK